MNSYQPHSQMVDNPRYVQSNTLPPRNSRYCVNVQNVGYPVHPSHSSVNLPPKKLINDSHVRLPGNNYSRLFVPRDPKNIPPKNDVNSIKRSELHPNLISNLQTSRISRNGSCHTTINDHNRYGSPSQHPSSRRSGWNDTALVRKEYFDTYIPTLPSRKSETSNSPKIVHTSYAHKLQQQVILTPSSKSEKTSVKKSVKSSVPEISDFKLDLDFGNFSISSEAPSASQKSKTDHRSSARSAKQKSISVSSSEDSETLPNIETSSKLSSSSSSINFMDDVLSTINNKQMEKDRLSIHRDSAPNRSSIVRDQFYSYNPANNISNYYIDTSNDYRGSMPNINRYQSQFDIYAHHQKANGHLNYQRADPGFVRAPVLNPAQFNGAKLYPENHRAFNGVDRTHESSDTVCLNPGIFQSSSNSSISTLADFPDPRRSKFGSMGFAVDNRRYVNTFKN
ncbi:hypothetical protein AYI68_g3841 [Smittium mucronatum]|uniref:Uncharacterized protein n=1 Tax=Smittium mucronatum TaxID=133383 RepID=A0A1R0GYQ7_9FUNG|nr:hypothetical protein AYI68_g3841 [Smittium mucronatum]